jgi:plastocyanin
MEDQSAQQPEQNNPKSSEKPGLIIAIVIIVAIAAFAFSQKGNNQNEVKDDESTMENKGQESTESMEPSMQTTPPVNTTIESDQSMMTGEVKTFTVSGSNFAFSPKEIKVKKGDKVKIMFKNTGGTHNWVLDEFSAKTAEIEDGESAEVTFTADKSGTFEFYCSVGSHRAMGMKGNLIVE